MDFSKLTGQPATIDESLEAFEFKPEGYENGMGKPLSITMHPGSGTRFKRAVRKMHIKMTRANNEPDTSDDLSEEELEAELRQQDSRTCELLARLCDGWNMTDGEKPLECTVDNATELFIQVEPLRVLADKEISERGNGSKAKKSA